MQADRRSHLYTLCCSKDLWHRKHHAGCRATVGTLSALNISLHAACSGIVGKAGPDIGAPHCSLPCTPQKSSIMHHRCGHCAGMHNSFTCQPGAPPGETGKCLSFVPLRGPRPRAASSAPIMQAYVACCNLGRSRSHRRAALVPMVGLDRGLCSHALWPHLSICWQGDIPESLSCLRSLCYSLGQS